MTADRDQAIVTATQVVLPGVVEPSGLQVRQRTLAPPAAGEVLVKVEAVGVSFAEQEMRRNRYPGQPKFPFVPGYDLVGVVTAVGPGGDQDLIGRRVAALTKIGGWASYALVPAAYLAEVPDGVGPAEAETMVVNGITAWQMLHRAARVRPGQTVLVHGANGGVGTILVQLARQASVTVIGTASPRYHDQLRALGVRPVDYHSPDLAARVRELAPGGMAARRDGRTPMVLLFLPLLTRLAVWNYLPNGHRATFYNAWAGSRRSPERFWARVRDDLGQVFALLRDGTLTVTIAARLPLSEVSAAMELAESGTVVGKVILEP